MSTQKFVIVGGGLAGATAATELRERGFDGEIRLFAAESHNPYIRPPLSKEYFTGKDGRDSIFVQPSAWYRDNDVILQTGAPVTALGDHTLTVGDARELGFDRLLLATGATPRRLSLPGSEADGIHYLRTVDDSERLRAELEGGGRTVVFVGSGWIGLELAAAARGYDNTVTVVAPEAIPLSGPLGDELGTMFRELHESNGVTFRMRTSVLGFDERDGHVTGVQTDAGTLPADVVVVGIGAIPDTTLARAAGLEVDNGILVDEHLATSAPDVFAAGDVANPFHPVVGQRMRNEHWATAIAGGKVAARSMLGEDVALDGVPYFYTDQYDLGMEYSGYPPFTRDARIVYRGDRAGREFIAFWLRGDVVVAGMNVNVWDVNESVQALIRSGKKVVVDRLLDPTVDLADL